MFQSTRRAALLGTVAILATSAVLTSTSSVNNAVAQEPPKSEQAPGYFRFKVGDAVVTAIYDGYFARPLKGFIRDIELPVVQDFMRSVHLSTEEYVSYYTTFVVQMNGKTILIDTGNGDSRPPTTGMWMSNFKAAGFDPAKVDAAIISHLHSDHFNGLRSKAGDEFFPNAAIYVPAPEYAYWMSKEKMDAAPEAQRSMFAGVRRVFEPFGNRIILFEPGKDVMSGIATIPAAGHTAGHTVFVISSGSSKFLYVADLIANPYIFARNPDWGIVFEADSQVAKQSKRRILDLASAEGILVCFAHGPFPGTGFVSRRGEGYDFLPLPYSQTL